MDPASLNPTSPTPPSTPPLAPAASAVHTLVASDLHLTEAEPPHPKYPFWKAYKQERHFPDQEFAELLRYYELLDEPIELVLNGDIFDFDAVMSLPVKGARSPDGRTFEVTWLEKLRGLNPEEHKSRFKMDAILSAHHVWVKAVAAFIKKGHRVVFVIGNHDLELHWPLVQQAIWDALASDEESRSRIRFCEWFYVSNKDTLIEHGNQFDAYCLAANPIHPMVVKNGSVRVRLPFGNMANRYLANGMAFLNPHADSAFIKESALDYLVFFYKHVVRAQPLLLWTWFWGAIVCWFQSMVYGLAAPLRDPLTVAQRAQAIAERSNAEVSQVWALKEIHEHPAIYSPFKIARELWLDRAVFLALIVFASFQVFTIANVFARVSAAWFFVPWAMLMPAFLFYSRGVHSEVAAILEQSIRMMAQSARVVGVRRVVQGHTHRALQGALGDIEYLNTGTWSAAFHDVECTRPYGKKCFAWIRPENAHTPERIASVYEWVKGEPLPLQGDRSRAHSVTAEFRTVSQNELP